MTSITQLRATRKYNQWAWLGCVIILLACHLASRGQPRIAVNGGCRCDGQAYCGQAAVIYRGTPVVLSSIVVALGAANATVETARGGDMIDSPFYP